MADTTPAFFPSGTSPDSGAALVNEVWQPDIERTVIEKMKFASTISARKRLFNKLHIRKLDEPTAQTLAASATGETLTSSEIADSEITLTPVAHYIYVVLSRSQMAQMDVDPRSPIREQVDDALAKKVDTACLQDVASLTTHTFGSSAVNIDRPLLLSALASLRNSSAAVDPGRTMIRLLYGPLQFDDIMSIDEITKADIRGDDANPNVKGIVVKALGLNLDVTGNLYSSAGELFNVMYVPEAFGISYNERPTVFSQNYLLSHRIIAYTNFGHNIVWDDRAAAISTKTT